MIDVVSGVLLSVSILLSTGRNVLTKNVSNEQFGTKRFFFIQTLIFFSGTALLLCLNIGTCLRISALTAILALIYGTLLVLAQWNYTLALKNGKTGICSTVYSLGFILPTIFGPLAYRETFSVYDLLGVLIVIPVIILTGMKKVDDEKKGTGYFIPLLIAMACSGGLGIMQKVQQHSAYADERTCFMLLAFSFATACSLLGLCFSKERKELLFDKKVFSGIGIGLAFASCNLLNTILAGKLPSTVFFPVLNVGTILFSLILGILCFKEKLTKKDGLIFSLGVISILLIAI